MGGRPLDIVQTLLAARMVDIGFHQIDEARDRGCGSFDVMGDGEQQTFTLLHDAAYFLIGILQIFPVCTFFLRISPDVPNQDDGNQDSDQSQ